MDHARLELARQRVPDLRSAGLQHLARLELESGQPVGIGQRPGDLPFGWQLSGGWEREDASQLDQRFDGKYARADITVPISPTVALLGGVGYEDVEIGQRDPVVDANGVPVLDANGRYVTDKSGPRILAYDVDGLIWDAGVLWRPSKRTALEAHVGRRYGSTSYYGSFAYAPNSRMSLNVSVYDHVTGFGGMLTRPVCHAATARSGG